MQQPKMTRHARLRLQQRGSRAKEVAIVVSLRRRRNPSPTRLPLLRLSRRAVAALLGGHGFTVQAITFWLISTA